MLELLNAAQKQIDSDDDFEKVVCDMLKKVYPEAVVGIYATVDKQLVLEGGTKFHADQIEHGLWEDTEYFDYLIEKFNHLDLVAGKVVRAVAAQCTGQRTPTYLVVGSKDFRVVFDDVDSSFVHMAVQMICRGWQNAALKESERQRDNFLRGITHQLRTPIHGILGSVELLAEELGMRDMVISSAVSRRGSITSSNSGDYRDPITYIKTIRSSARELITTVNSLINLNRWSDIAQAERINAPHHIHEIETVLLNEVIHSDQDQLSTRPSIMFKHQFPPNFDTLTLDIRLFADCIVPLITNAVQATEGGIVCVTITVTNDHKSLIVDVEDTGRGISPDYQEGIFRSYEKVDPHTTGAGLGLTLASRLATIMDGTVALVRSEVGKGSHFRAQFAEPTCTISPASSPSKMSGAGRQSMTFDTLSPPGTTSLTDYFSGYLRHRGHVQSPSSDGSISIFDYIADSQYQQQSPQMEPGKVGICLVPDSAPYAFMNDGHQIRRENSTLYVKGPFLSNVLEDALDQAHDLRVEFEALKNVPEIKITTEDTVEPFPLSAAIDDPPSAITSPVPSPTPESFKPELVDTLTESLQTIRIETTSPPIDSPMKPTTLLVDDNAVNLRFLEMYCRRRAIPHLKATDGEKAVTVFSTHQTSAFNPDRPSTDVKPIELILMDLQMPNCDGAEATKRIRELEKENGWKKSKIIIVTGQDSLSDRLKSREVGADGFFVKPVGPKVLDKGMSEWFPEAKI